MLYLDPEPKFWAPVTVPGLGDEDEPQAFRACFLALDIDDFNEHELGTPAGSERFLGQVLVDVDQVEGPAGPLGFADCRTALLGSAVLRSALIRAYLAAFDKATRGN